MFKMILERNHDEIVHQTQELIRIRSVEGTPDKDYPFGPGPAKALQYALQIGAAMGFRTRNFDNYAGDIEIGQGQDIVGILAHVDVVAEGSDWTYPPFEGQVHDGCIYGRGALDDKGPIIATLHAMQAVVACGCPLNKRVRLILGTNEETGSQGIAYYLNIKDAPHVAFTPDADFPLIRGEKGILKVKLNKSLALSDHNNTNPLSITGGLSVNAVPDECVAEVLADFRICQQITSLVATVDPPGKLFHIDPMDQGLRIKSFGISAHGSTPEAGRNAISQILCLLSQVSFENEPLDDFLSVYTSKIGMDFNGQRIGLGFKDDISGPLTMNVGKITLNSEKIDLTLDIRYPLKTAMVEVIEAVETNFSAAGFGVDIYHKIDPIYFPRKHPLIQKLMGVYQKVTGDYASQPLIIGGGTYARALEQAVAFGPLFPGRKDTAHQKDEHMRIDDLMKCAEIYAHAIAELAG
jgi:succinyl-diaminopimelate desuccinylase